VATVQIILAVKMMVGDKRKFSTCMQTAANKLMQHHNSFNSEHCNLLGRTVSVSLEFRIKAIDA